MKKITSCLLAEGAEPRKSNGEDGSRNLRCTGADQVQEWRPRENWPLETRERRTAAERNGGGGGGRREKQSDLS